MAAASLPLLYFPLEEYREETSIPSSGSVPNQVREFSRPRDMHSGAFFCARCLAIATTIVGCLRGSRSTEIGVDACLVVSSCIAGLPAALL